MIDLLNTAELGSRAAEDGDGGRSAYLMQTVADAMSELTLKECEWLSVAVSNGTFAKQLSEAPPITDYDVDVQKTDKGEVWDI